MKRCDFILTVVSAAAFLSKAQAQQTSAVLGVLGNGSQQAVRFCASQGSAAIWPLNVTPQTISSIGSRRW
jgi:putative tryptophan/tyrosine transport system substrate-binding protein